LIHHEHTLFSYVSSFHKFPFVEFIGAPILLPVILKFRNYS